MLELGGERRRSSLVGALQATWSVVRTLPPEEPYREGLGRPRPADNRAIRRALRDQSAQIDPPSRKGFDVQPPAAEYDVSWCRVPGHAVGVQQRRFRGRRKYRRSSSSALSQPSEAPPSPGEQHTLLPIDGDLWFRIGQDAGRRRVKRAWNSGHNDTVLQGSECSNHVSVPKWAIDTNADGSQPPVQNLSGFLLTSSSRPSPRTAAAPPPRPGGRAFGPWGLMPNGVTEAAIYGPSP